MRKTTSVVLGGSRASSSHESDLGQQRAKAWVTTSPRTEKQFTPEQSTSPGAPTVNEPWPMPAAVLGLRRIKHDMMACTGAHGRPLPSWNSDICSLNSMLAGRGHSACSSVSSSTYLLARKLRNPVFFSSFIAPSYIRRTRRRISRLTLIAGCTCASPQAARAFSLGSPSILHGHS